MMPQRAILAAATLALSACSLGCFGLYVEGHANYYPTLKYSENDNPTAAEKVEATSGGGFAIGFNVGMAFEGQRSGRFSMGYIGQSTSLPGGGSASGGMSDARFDIKLARIGPSRRLRLGFGFGFGSGGKTTMKNANGDDVEVKGGTGQGYIGPVFAQYLGKKHEVSLMLAGSYLGISAPNGAVGGAGVGIKLAYTIIFGDTRPDVTLVTPLDSSKNLMPLVERGAKNIGCSASYGEHRDETEGGGYGLVGAYVFARCNGESINFFQVKSGVVVTCSHMDDEAECQSLVDRILDGAKTSEPPKVATPPPPPPTAATPPPPAPPPAPVPETAPPAQ